MKGGVPIIDKARLAEAWADGETTRAIGEMFGVSRGAVSAMARTLGLPPRHVPPDDVAFAAAWAEGLTHRAIADRFGLAEGTISYHVRRLKLPLRRAGSTQQANGRSQNGGPPKVDWEKAVALRDEGMTCRAVAERFGVSDDYVRRRTNALRRPSPAAAVAPDRPSVARLRPVVAVEAVPKPTCSGAGTS